MSCAALTKSRNGLTEACTEREALEARVAKLDGERLSLQEEVRTLRGILADLEMEIQAEQELSHSMALAAWEAMEAFQGAVADLNALPPPRRHIVWEMDISLERLRRAGEVCLSATWAYEDHCMKVSWTTAFASLQKAGCGHVDTLTTRSVPVATAEKVVVGHCQT